MGDAFQFWDREVQAPIHVSWMGQPTIRAYINHSITGSFHEWPFDWFQKTYPGRTFERALSIGCGTGALERPLIARGICRRVDAFDGSIGSLAVATQEARKQNLEGIHYFAGDFNDPHLPADRYDIVFFHQSLHHVAKLEKLFRQVRRALKPGGLLYLDEFIGPSRTDWDEELTATYRRLYKLVKPEWRLYEELPAPIQADDPSEAIRSGEIMPELEAGFDVKHFRGYGGNIISVIYPALRTELLPQEFIDEMVAYERQWLAEKRQKYPFYAVIVAEPKAGLRGAVADVRYFTLPKLKRIGREVRQLLAGMR
jgi:SAM-dependent methyltransferase